MEPKVHTPRLRAGAAACKTMSDVRANIDRVDRQIVELLAERLSYIEQAGVIKQDRDVVRDPARVEDVVAKVKAAGAGHHLPETYLDDVYRFLIEWSIQYEFKVYDAREPAQ